jgi:hypothetical protein
MPQGMLRKSLPSKSVEDDRINANNTFDNKSQVLTAPELAEVKKPKAALFARISDTQARLHACVYI